MKKIVLIFSILGFLAANIAYAQPNDSDKSRWRSAKKRAKELVHEGWKVDGSRSIEELLYLHYQKLADETNQELIGNVIGNTSVKTLNQGQQWAATNASISYAKQARQMVTGRINADISAGVEDAPSVDSFYEGYEAIVAKEINGELRKSFSVYREKKDGCIDYKAFYIVNEEAASKARIKAMEYALKESEFARENAEKISEFVRNGFLVQTEE